MFASVRLRLLFLIVAIFLSGCAKSTDGRLAISGTVMFKEQPLDEGTIQFYFKDKNELANGATIREGKYTIPAQQGLRPGTYRVMISSGEPGPKPSGSEPVAPGSQPARMSKERIPPEYNSQSEKNPVLREVKEGQKNEFNFDFK